MAVKKSTKKDKELSLEDVLWNCRVALRGIGSTEKNRDAVIGLVFLKFSGDKFEKRHAQLKEEYPNLPDKVMEKPSFYNSDNVFYLDEKSRWSYIVENASSSKIAVILDEAMSSIEEKNPSLKGALPQNLYSSLGANNRDIKSLIDEVNKISQERFNEQDLIGRVYEYFLRIYAAAGTKEDGEFYTPASVVKLISELIEPYSGTVYDPCCGSGGMFVQSMKFVEQHNGNKKEISVLGQEKNPSTWRLCKMNLAVRGISSNLGEKADSTFTNDLHKDKKVDYIMANPPFNLKNWRGKDELKDDPRFQGYGEGVIPPVSNANYAWITHIISKLDVNHGVAGFLLANGALNADGDEYEIRKSIIEKDLLEAIIVLPRDMFYTTDISVTLWIINMNKKGSNQNGRELRDRSNEILFVDLRQWNKNIEVTNIDKGKKKRKVAFTDEQIASIKNIYDSWQNIDGEYTNVPELCQGVTVNDIREHDYNLAPSQYIKFIDHDLEIDYRENMKDYQKILNQIIDEEIDTEKKLRNAMKVIGYEID